MNVLVPLYGFISCIVLLFMLIHYHEESKKPGEQKIYIFFWIVSLFCMSSSLELMFSNKHSVLETCFIDIKETTTEMKSKKQYYIVKDMGYEFETDDMRILSGVYDKEKFHVVGEKVLYHSPNFLNDVVSWKYSVKEKK